MQILGSLLIYSALFSVSHGFWSFYEPTENEIHRWNSFIRIHSSWSLGQVRFTLAHKSKGFQEFASSNNFYTYVSKVSWTLFAIQGIKLTEVKKGSEEIERFADVQITDLPDCGRFLFELRLIPTWQVQHSNTWFNHKNLNLLSPPDVRVTVKSLGPTAANITFALSEEKCKPIKYSFTCSNLGHIFMDEENGQARELMPGTSYSGCKAYIWFKSLRNQHNWIKVFENLTFTTPNLTFSLSNWTDSGVDFQLWDPLYAHLHYHLSIQEVNQTSEKRFLTIKDMVTRVRSLRSRTEYTFCLIINKFNLDKDCSPCNSIYFKNNAHLGTFAINYPGDSHKMILATDASITSWRNYTLLYSNKDNSTQPTLEPINVIIRPGCPNAKEFNELLNHNELNKRLNIDNIGDINDSLCVILHMKKHIPSCDDLKQCFPIVSFCEQGKTLEESFSQAQALKVIYFLGPTSIIAGIALVALLVLLGMKGKSFARKSSSMPLEPLAKGPSNPIKVAELKYLLKDDEISFKDEFRELDRAETIHITLNKSSDEAAKYEHLNRYRSILPYDDSRVILSNTKEGYINASWIKIPVLRSCTYIATQGPTKITKDHFWAMIFEKKVQIIVMLTKLVEKPNDNKSSVIKCAMYWPTLGSGAIYEEIGVSVELIQEVAQNSELTERHFKVMDLRSASILMVIQLHYTGWPDHGVPSAPSKLLNLRSELRKKMDSMALRNITVVVHCSAGVGRTGTLIALDALLQKVDRGASEIDILRTVFELRMNRCLMVQTRVQYQYLYKCIGHYIDQARISKGKS